ncbi:AN1-type zinc finger protein 4-like [Uloborus diversus]|uniref:AN1-type zinc finger protein 4-like n=1 Tax=Uloborus diversus TaxID=327109 RepID=UPI00240A7A68|nr:AN1-type zinc finger protein 4-like [Uloborus diversus]
MAENRMELFIETLTGTAFELSCSPLETIVSIKAKIQYSEGIPVSQQHLIWKSQELNDDLCLQDYCIKDGATLKLVLGMRGGPINTRQVSESKKLKDLADYVERRSETGGSSGSPFTVLVFHDGDKVHMYTLMDRGDCSISPLSGTISETSSVASIKHVEELDQELMRENEITKEKIAQLQEQIRTLNINRSKKAIPSISHGKGYSRNTFDVSSNREFHLPPLQRIDSLNSQSLPYVHRDGKKNSRSSEKSYLTHFAPKVGRNCSPGSESLLSTLSHESVSNIESKQERYINVSERNAVLDSVLNRLSITPEKNNATQKSQSCSSFLPYIESAQGNCSIQKKHNSNSHAQSTQLVGISLSSSCITSFTKNDSSRKKNAHKQPPHTSSQSSSCQRLLDLEEWFQNRPKTTPELATPKTAYSSHNICKNKSLRKRRIKQSFRNPLSVTLSSGENSSLMVQSLSKHSDISYDIPSSVSCKEKPYYSHSSSKTGLETLVANLKALRSYSPQKLTMQDNSFSKVKSTKTPPRPSEEIRPCSGRKLPLIKSKKKSHKRCSLCSKKTGLATSFTCRCGKNFCASHRYAEVHHCTYDYKTEGRRILQLNNPVVTASKLPKI